MTIGCEPVPPTGGLRGRQLAGASVQSAVGCRIQTGIVGPVVGWSQSNRCFGRVRTCGLPPPLFAPRRSRPPAGWPTSRSTTRTSTSTSTTSTGERGRPAGLPQPRNRDRGRGRSASAGVRVRARGRGRVRVAARGGSAGPGPRPAARCSLPFVRGGRAGRGAAGSAPLPRPPQSGRGSPGLGARPGGSGPRGHLRWDLAGRRAARGGASGTSRRVPGAGRGSGQGLRARSGTPGRSRRWLGFCVAVLRGGGGVRAAGKAGA